ncbi:MAG: hypothetical protein ACO271_11680 [Burkholderiales bacterium]
MLSLPMHLEHFLLARSVARTGAGELLHPDTAPISPPLLSLNAMLRYLLVQYGLDDCPH